MDRPPRADVPLRPRIQQPTPEEPQPVEIAESFPDGGAEAFSALFGCTCAGFAGLALLNCPGTLQAWISKQELPDQGIARLGWIFGFYTFMAFFAGIQIGPVFDAYGPRAIACTGSVLTLATYLILGACHQYWHFFLTLGVLGGTGTSMLLTCAVSTVQLWFYRYRGTATAAALCGGSISGIAFPLMLQALFPKIGFAWTMRAVALMICPFLIVGCLLMRRRRPVASRQSPPWRSLLFDPRLLTKPDILVISLGVYFLEWGLFIVITYLSSYALQQDISFKIAYQLLTYLNVGALIGRFGAGFLGDRLGRFNAQVVIVAFCCVSILGIWLPAGNRTVPVILFSVVFGLCCGSNISLTPVCLGQLCDTEMYGRTFTGVYTVASIG